MGEDSITFIKIHSKKKMKLIKWSYLFAFFSLAVFNLNAQYEGIERETLIYEDTLALDFFISKTKSKQPKPLLIYVHGGGFAGGERDHPNHIRFCEYFAKKGWATATISYHLTMKGQSFSCDQPVQNKKETILHAAQNINQSVAYLRDHAKEFNLDITKVVIAGSSAGAEAVIHSAYWKKSQVGILEGDFKYAGVISMAGALLDENWITNETAIPTALFHGTCDNLVPYATASHHYCQADKPGFMMLFGSLPIAMKLKSLNRGYYLVTDCGGGHEWNEKPIRPEYIYMIEDFLENEVLKNQGRQITKVFKEGKGNCASNFDFCLDD